MSVKVADKIVQMNGQNYPLMDASAVNYDNSDSGLLSTEVQGAIDELAGIIKSLEMLM